MTKLQKLTNWVKARHAGQFIKASGEPYFEHCLAVAQMAAPKLLFGYEAGLCHDILEKTQTSTKELFQALHNFGYDQDEANIIINLVVELTDVYTKSIYTDLKKSVRKNMEEFRSALISPDAQTIKYADLDYNIRWMITYDRKHAKKYLKRKLRLLSKMNKGDPDLYKQAYELSLQSLSILFL